MLSSLAHGWMDASIPTPYIEAAMLTPLFLQPQNMERNIARLG